MTIELAQWPVDAVRTYCHARESASARDSFGAPFVAAPATRAFVALSSPADPPLAALVFTIAGGVASIESFAPARGQNGVSAALLHKFEEAASYNNCHKMIARVKRDGVEHAQLAAVGFRVASVVERHHFQSDFVDMVKWLA